MLFPLSNQTQFTLKHILIIKKLIFLYKVTGLKVLFLYVSLPINMYLIYMYRHVEDINETTVMIISCKQEGQLSNQLKFYPQLYINQILTKQVPIFLIYVFLESPTMTCLLVSIKLGMAGSMVWRNSIPRAMSMANLRA